MCKEKFHTVDSIPNNSDWMHNYFSKLFTVENGMLNENGMGRYEFSQSYTVLGGG